MCGQLIDIVYKFHVYLFYYNSQNTLRHTGKTLLFVSFEEDASLSRVVLCQLDMQWGLRSGDFCSLSALRGKCLPDNEMIVENQIQDLATPEAVVLL